jgi:hypothetical protein
MNPPHKPFQPLFDRQDQLQMVGQYLLPNEVVEAVFDCHSTGTGFVGVTNRRVILLDPAYLNRGSAMVSIPYSKVSAVAIRGRAVVISCGSVFHEQELKNQERARTAHDWILNHCL